MARAATLLGYGGLDQANDGGVGFAEIAGALRQARREIEGDQGSERRSVGRRSGFVQPRRCSRTHLPREAGVRGDGETPTTVSLITSIGGARGRGPFDRLCPADDAVAPAD